MMHGKSLKIIALVVFAVGFIVPLYAGAATAPSLGTANPHGVATAVFTNSNTPPQTIINGAECATTQPTAVPLTITGATSTPCDPQVGLDQNSALNNVVNGLNSQVCAPISGALSAVSIGTNPPGTFPPGCYSTIGAMNITLGTTVTLDATAPGGTGNVWIFRSTGALNSGNNSFVTLANGASANNVFWAPVGLATIGAFTTGGVPPLGPTFVGNILDPAGITFGHFANLSGRALAFGGTVTTDANTITVPPAAATLHVVKVVNNAGGGSAVVSDFNLHVKTGGVDVPGSPTLGIGVPGTSFTLAAGTYAVSEDANVSYTQVTSGACDLGGIVTLTPGANVTCTITNTFIPAPPPPPPPPPLPPATLHVIKLVVNGSGGTAIPADFTLHVKSGGVDVAGSPAVGVAALGTPYTLTAGTYLVSEDPHAGYVQTFLIGDCSAGGVATLLPGDDKICTVINTDIPPPPAPLIPPTASSPAGRSGGIVPLIGILKVPTPLALPSGPGPVTYNYTLWNLGSHQALVGVNVTDNMCSPLTFLSGDDNRNGKLDVSERWLYNCTTTLSQTTTNTAVATGFGDDTDHTPAIATAIATVAVGLTVPGLPNTGLAPPLINIVKVPNRLTPFPFGGGLVTYTYTVTNPGVVPMNNVSVVDNACAPVIRTSGDTNNLLDPGEAWVYNCRTNVPVSTRNVATARGNANGFVAIGFAFATVLVAAPGLPNTGFSPYESDTPWRLTASMGLLLGSLTLLVVLRRRQRI